MAPTFDEIKVLIAPSEGNIAFMYLDTKGYVTVGIGNMLPSASEAVKLSFVNRTTKNKATPAEITADFDAVSKQPKAMAANYYRQYTKTDLPDIAINLLFSDRVDQFQGALKAAYPKYESYPEGVQLALLDMAFNLGVSALKSPVKWPKLNTAIANEDWTAASVECYRPDANAIRNAKIKALFEDAEKASAK
jgi:GH24 family phage-related lysozyme (muramidase)